MAILFAPCLAISHHTDPPIRCVVWWLVPLYGSSYQVRGMVLVATIQLPLSGAWYGASSHHTAPPIRSEVWCYYPPYSFSY